MINKYKVLFGGLLLAMSTSALCEQLALPSSDLVAPEVQHEAVTVPIDPSKNFTFNVTAKDDVAVKSVVLFYRPAGQSNYSRKMFLSVGGDNYQVDLTPEELSTPKVEYYIKVEDTSGNTLLYGQSFSPLFLVTKKEGASGTPVAGATSPSIGDPSTSKGITLLGANPESAPATDSHNESILKNKWLWIGVGVVAAALAASSGGGDSSPSASAAPKPTINITGPTVPGQ